MSEHFFHIGEMVYSIANESVHDTGEVLWSKLSAAECPPPATAPAVRFIFRDRIESPGEPVTRIARAAVGLHTLTYQDHSRLRMQIYRNASGGVDVVLSEGRYPWLREVFHHLNKRWKYHYCYGMTMKEGLAQKVLYSGILPLLYLTLPAYDMTLVTASAVAAPDGKALLLAGRRGSGRTVLTGQLMEQGWKFLGNDLVALHADGTVWPLALPLRIYPLHQKYAPRLIERMLQAMTPEERSLWQSAALTGRKNRLRWMRAERIWGGDQLLRQAPAGRIIILQREQKRTEPAWRNLSASDAAQTLSAMALNELRRAPALAVINSCAAGANLCPAPGTVLTRAQAVISRAAEHLPVQAVHLPEAPDYEALASQINAFPAPEAPSLP